MKITKEENSLTFNFDGTIVFFVNDEGVMIDKSAQNENYTIKNGYFVGKGKNNFIARIKNCIILYKFMKTGNNSV